MKSISTKSLQNLPDIVSLEKLLQSLAVLDLIMSPEWEDRYYSFDSKWGEGETMGSMRNGCGDSFNALFDKHGCFFKGLAHDYPLSSWREGNLEKWKEVINKVPNEFSSATSEPAFDMDGISFCFWRAISDETWTCGSIDSVETDDPDGSEFLLECLDGEPSTYQKFVEEYYEEEIPLSPIEHIYDHMPLTQELVNMLNPDVILSDIRAELIEIGYPANE